MTACGSDSTGPPPPPLTITTEALPDITLDVEYSEGLDAEGGDESYEWEISEGTLPPGLDLVVEDLVDNDALISGLPTQEGTFTFSVRVTSGDGQSFSREFEITVLPPEALAIGNPVLPPALATGPYAVQLRGTGGTGSGYTWSLVGGTLPAGLTLTAGGFLEGTPETTDTVTLTLQVDDGVDTYTEDFVLRVLADQPDIYNITPVPVSPIPAGIQPHVDAAIEQWESVIAGDLVPVAIPAAFLSPTGCGGFGEGLSGTTVDDILVMINIDDIDGAGNVLGRAGPCIVRDAANNRLTIGGILTLDSGDLLPLVGTGTLTHIIAHEIGHILGFGSLWEQDPHDFLTGAGTNDPRFSGEAAMAEWHDLGGAGEVPVEGTGGEGTAESHWRETTFGSELMTGFSEQIGTFQPLSRVTIAAMDDLGYVVDYSAADPYSLGSGLRAPGSTAVNLGYDIVLREPLRELDTSRIPLDLTRSRGGTP